jgi:NAD(P)-dependent dehydrogenase (short-subunit alcohol dehydrogenase family)
MILSKSMQEAIPRLKNHDSGNVIMITSCRTELPLPGGAIPDIARAGANALVKSLSLELAPFGIPVNAIASNYLYGEA